MTVEDEAADDLRIDEGFLPHAYMDTLGFWTIGYGHLIDKRRGGGISKRIAELILKEDVMHCSMDLTARFPWFPNMTKARQKALINMRFQLGNKLYEFKEMLKALSLGNYKDAAAEAMNSDWAKQTPARAARIADAILSG